MAELGDNFLRALRAHLDSGQGLAVAMSHDWRCCAGAIDKGPGACTCWEPEYDQDQTLPSAETVCALALGKTQPDVRDGMCGDCAYRPGSPERTGNKDFTEGPEKLDTWARESRFFCHDGFRQPVAWRHPVGVRIEVSLPGDYQPLIVDGVAYRTDGRPGLLCAGWDARRRALAARAQRDTGTGGDR